MSCPYPFVPLKDYPPLGGDVGARVCNVLPVSGSPNCCLPCPRENLFYPDSFQTLVHVTTYINLVSVVACGFLLISFLVLPVEYTHRHYLSVCTAFSILLLQMSFVIPLGNPNAQCYDKITPHDMYSSVNCAVSGAFVLGGGWCTVMWVFLRTLSLHLQICWQVVPGRRFFISAQIIGWSIPIVFLAIALSLTGVSFRFGESCHINSNHGLQTFWGPLLAVAAASIVLQALTFGYCTQVYLRSLFEDRPAITQASHASSLPYSNSIRTTTAFQALRRIRRVVALQWRGMLIIVIILVDVIFFATVFLQFDGITLETSRTSNGAIHSFMWLECMLEFHGDKDQCLSVADELVISEGTALGVLFLLSLPGTLSLVLLGRPSIFRGWYHYISGFFESKKVADEFVSYHARRTSEPVSSYEVLESKQRSTASTNDLILMKPVPAISPLSRDMNHILEYNPSTFSAQLRGRANSDLTTSPFSPFHDLDSGSRSPPPFSPYQDLPDCVSQNSATERRSTFAVPPERSGPPSPFLDSPVSQSPARNNSLRYPEEVRIGVAR